MRIRIILLLLGAALTASIFTRPYALSAQARPTPPPTSQAAAAPVPSSAPVSTPSAHDFDAEIAPFFKTYCTGCHGGATPRGGFRLTFASEDEARAKLKDDDEF